MKWKISEYGGAWMAENGYGVTVWADTREKLEEWLGYKRGKQTEWRK